MDRHPEGGHVAGPIVEAIIVEAVTIATSEAAILANVPIDVVPVTSRKLASAPPVKVVVGPNSVGFGGIASNAHGNCVGLDGHRKRGEGAAGSIEEAVTIATPEGVILAKVPIEVVPVTSRKPASAPPVKVVVGPNSVNFGGIARDAHGKCIGLDGHQKRGEGAAGSIV